jgi:hypothetical protein
MSGFEDQREILERIQNDIEVVKTRVSSLDRLAVLEHRDRIIEDIAGAVDDRYLVAAVLHLTEDEVGRQELSDALEIDARNLNKYVNPVMGKKGYLNEFTHNGKKSYRRDEKLDLIGFEEIPQFKDLLEKWKKSREVKSK